MFEARINQYLGEVAATRRRHLREATTLPGGRVLIDGKELINFASNDYLGLAATADWGLDIDKGDRAACASRLIAGNHPLYEIIEKKLASLKGTEAALVLGTGFQANATVIPALLSRRLHGARAGNRQGPQVNVFADRLVHASFHAGLNAAHATQIRFRHNDLGHLEELLERYQQAGVCQIILTESVFSMDGDRSDVDTLRQLASRYHALLYVDEAHATGVLGVNGMGLMAQPGKFFPDNEEVVLGTFSKAFGAFGAYVACSQAVKDYLVNHCAGLIYSTALPPSLLALIAARLDLIPGLNAKRAHLLMLANRARSGLQSLGMDCLDSTTQIVPALIGSDAETVEVASQLESDGFLVGAIRPPTVPAGTARLRISLSAEHRLTDVDRLLSAIGRRVEKLR